MNKNNMDENNKKMTFISAQLALFFNNRIEKISDMPYELNKDLDEIFNQDPIILPLPDDSRFDNTPIAQLRSTSEYSSRIARKRSDFLLSNKDDERKYFPEQTKKEFLEKAIKFFNFFNSKKDLRIVRIGFVSNFFVETKETYKMVASLINQDLRNLHGKSKNDFESNIRYVSQSEMAGFSIVNNNTIIGNGVQEDNNGSRKIGVLITKDFNTSVKENYSFNNGNIRDFINESFSNFKLEEIEKILWEKI